ncbi:hypothetical protein QTO34_001840 [Cnephaeus nilssonii]|uniref:GDNF-inducible zinc finger protein 1 n=1 Tax=Cnephaeus nilssonii TaxID=3371016 RepID=A0AA40LM67_CNENI|nr:hypothetical protein QTO34_001840 [Eptesicus nilssonii]
MGWGELYSAHAVDRYRERKQLFAFDKAEVRDSEGMCFVWFGFLIKELDIVVAINCYSFGMFLERKNMESGAVLLESKSSPANLLHEMHQLRLLGHLCDVTVSVEYQGVREEFMAHKAVLAATSKFFKEMFLNEKTMDGTRTNVYLHEVQVVDFASFLEFVYTAKVQVEEDRVQRMLEMAEKLKCLDLSETCFQLKKQMLESVLLELQNFSESQEVEGSSGSTAVLLLTLGQRISNGTLPDLSPRKSKEKPDKKKDGVKPSYPKVRRASGRLAGRKVFVEIPKKKYTRRLREQQKSAEDDVGDYRCTQHPGPDTVGTEDEPVTKSEDFSAGVEVGEALQKAGQVGEEEEEGEEGEEEKRKSNFKCTICEKSFLYEKSFLKHIRHHHGVATEVIHRCDTCGQTFANRCNLKSHQRHVHSSERHFPCELCGKKFKRKKDVKRHVVQVHEGGGERHQCQQCGKGLSSKTALRLHERTHTGHKPYGCTECEAKFSQPSALKTHMRIHTGEKPFVCDECEARFTQNHMLIYHKRCHTGERPYCCDQCGKQFTQLNALQRHHRIHTGEKPFMCNACGRTFTDKSTLRRHTSVHDKNTPWKSFLVIVDGSPKNDEGHKTEQPDEEYASSKLSDKLLSFAENNHFHNLATVPGSVSTVHENNSANTACKSDNSVVSQDALLATTISELSELTPQTDLMPTQLHSLTTSRSESKLLPHHVSPNAMVRKVPLVLSLLLLEQQAGNYEAFRKPPARRRLSEGLAPAQTDRQLPCFGF